MYELKAFALIGALVDNTRAKVAPVGELSSRGFTYSREKEYFNNAAAPGHNLVVFSSKTDGTVAQTDAALANQLLLVVKWIYEQAAAGAFLSTTDSFRTAFIAQWNATYSLYTTGAMVQAGTNVWCPGYIEIRPQTDDTRHYKLWFADEAFTQQYDEYEILVVPPIEDIEIFFEGSDSINDALAARTPDVLMQAIEAAKDGDPESFLQSEPFDWVDPNNIVANKTTYWSVVIYGIAGRNIDAIKEAIRDYILANSEHSKDEWEVIFPEIFTATEFIIVPMWGQYSVPNKVEQTGLGSSITKFRTGEAQLLRLVRGEGYTQEWLEEHGEVMATTHKQYNAVVIGGPKNRDGIVELYQRYPDYMAIRSTDTDVMRMDPETRRFILALEAMMIIAEGMTPDSTVPVQYTRMTRDGVLMVVGTVDKFQFLIVSKYSYLDDSIGQSSDANEPALPA
jgi:hypothetical protein